MKRIMYSLVFLAFSGPVVHAAGLVCEDVDPETTGYQVVLEPNLSSAKLLHDGKVLVKDMVCDAVSTAELSCRVHVVNSQGHQVKVTLRADGKTPDSVRVYSDGFAGPQPETGDMPCP